MEYPLISALCPTHARAPEYQWMLDESVYWFTRQTWPNRELIILNDDPGQALVCNVPGVRVINMPIRCPSLGMKYQLLLEAARGEYAMLWEDDDISTSARMSQAAEHLGNDYDFWNPQYYFFQQGRDGPIHHAHPMGISFNCSVFRTAKFRGRYPARMTDVDGRKWLYAGFENQDAVANSFAKNEFANHPKWEPLKSIGFQVEDSGMRWNRKTLEGRPDLWTFVYRFGITANHFSGQATAETAEQVWRSQAPGVPGVYEIVPRMRLDYVALCDEAAKKAVFPAV